MENALTATVNLFDSDAGLSFTGKDPLSGVLNKDLMLGTGVSAVYNTNAVSSEFEPLPRLSSSLLHSNTKFNASLNDDQISRTSAVNSRSQDSLLGVEADAAPLVGDLTESTTATITAIATGSQTPLTATVPNTVINGDFLISSTNPIATTVGNSLDERTTWTFDFTQGSDLASFLNAESLSSATLTLELIPGTTELNDTPGIDGLRYVIFPEIATLPVGQASTITINLLDTYSSEEILNALKNGELGKLPMYYADDAIVSFAKIELTGDIRSPKRYAIDLKDLGLTDKPVQIGRGVWFLGKGIHPNDLRIAQPININAADTTNADQLWFGGGLGLALDGNGLTVGVWEANEGMERWKISDTHQELVGRVTVVDPGNGASTHATHVAGTIGAAGINPNVRGMANQIALRSYDTANDLNEMADAAAIIAASNHSYTWTVEGWAPAREIETENAGIVNNTDIWLQDYSISSVEDENFGRYDSNSLSLDEVLSKNPNLLSVWAAGNDRDNSYSNRHMDNTYVTYFGSDPGITGLDWNAFDAGWYQVPVSLASPPQSDGNGGVGYDSLTSSAVAKNNLVVGAINAVTGDPYTNIDVAMSGFSSWGPTDDGRIKPDVVADGVDLLSSVPYDVMGNPSDTEVRLGSGTSMATPSVTGAAVLLIQHYQDLFGAMPRSSTTKGLLLHTAFDATTNPNPTGLPLTGPDYVYGWGVVDAAAAANFLTTVQNPASTSFFRERTYIGNEQVIAVESDGVDPLKVSVAWTDPVGTSQDVGLDVRTPALVHDLDIRVISPDGTTYYPWTLDPNNPNAPAEQDTPNNLDNVEQVLINTPVAGTYQVRISHKGEAFAQDYSLLASGARFTRDIFEGVYEGGQDWGSGVFNSRGVTSLSSGDVDGDGNDELAVGRNSGEGTRFYLLDFNYLTTFIDLLEDQGGRDWGNSRGVTSLSFGDVDGDGNDELAVGRNSGEGTRFYLFDYVNGGLVDLLGDQGGRDWGDNRGITSLSFGDVDGDGNDEVALGRNSGEGARFYLFDYVNGGLVDLLGDQGGREWGNSRGVTSLSFGDVDGDGNDEIAVGRNAGEGTHYFLLDYINGAFVNLLEEGRNWGDSRGVTSLSFGDIDGDGNHEVALGRDSGDGARFFILDHANGEFVDLLGDQGGRDWGDSRGVTSLSSGDVNSDGNDEIAVGRNSGDNARFYLFDYINGGLVDLLGEQGGRNWGGDRGVTSLSFGDVDGDSSDELAVGRNVGDGARYVILNPS